MHKTDITRNVAAADVVLRRASIVFTSPSFSNSESHFVSPHDLQVIEEIVIAHSLSALPFVFPLFYSGDQHRNARKLSGIAFERPIDNFLSNDNLFARRYS